MNNIAFYTINQLEKHNRECAIEHANSQYSSNQFIKLILNIGRHLLINGVKPSDVVATEFYSPINTLAGSLAVGLIGATSLSHPPSAPKKEAETGTNVSIQSGYSMIKRLSNPKKMITRIFTSKT